ncbi:mitochondrial inner membrane protease ATP23 homolog isoform X2 [Aphidius gifuensis]|uniref:mitochondrial inner membrane protease ATP23 homolog isoform X2 n=1 Tax=Aphidius gifuensis TaxID=684658 RepID=UPI001CDD349C|nr:mitochondrial inner membrane protease ATP23 homolog isoform X2 [Aphidius gifuensis]
MSTFTGKEQVDSEKLKQAQAEKLSPKKTYPDEHGELYGHDLYPERRGNKQKTIKNIVLMKDGTEHIARLHCEQRVFNCIKKHPLVKIMMSALKSAGCPVDLRRHLSCEECDSSVTGGYDPELNQIVICQNTARIEGIVACTEIRAANLTYCSFMSAMIDGDAALWDMKKKHQECVKRRATLSVLAARGVSTEEARAAVERVFDKCYNDLEPIGRRIKRNTDDMNKAFFDAPYYGYDT